MPAGAVVVVGCLMADSLDWISEAIALLSDCAALFEKREAIVAETAAATSDWCEGDSSQLWIT